MIHNVNSNLEIKAKYALCIKYNNPPLHGQLNETLPDYISTSCQANSFSHLIQPPATKLNINLLPFSRFLTRNSATYVYTYKPHYFL